MLGASGAETGGRNLPAMMVPGKPGLVQLKTNSVLPPGAGCWPAMPLPMARSPVGTVTWISAVKRSV